MVMKKYMVSVYVCCCYVVCMRACIYVGVMCMCVHAFVCVSHMHPCSYTVYVDVCYILQQMCVHECVYCVGGIVWFHIHTRTFVISSTTIVVHSRNRHGLQSKITQKTSLNFPRQQWGSIS